MPTAGLPALMAALTLAACAPANGESASSATPGKALPGPPVAQESPPQEPAMSMCDADKARFAVGRPYSESLAEQARTAAGARIVRRLMPGQAVTMEFNAERLNIETDDAGRVTAVRCG